MIACWFVSHYSSLVSRDPSEITKCWVGAKESFLLIINAENNSDDWYFKKIYFKSYWYQYLDIYPFNEQVWL